MINIADKILSKYEDSNEYHFHKIDREWIIEAMEEYSEYNCDLLQNLYSKPNKILKPLEELYIKENPRSDGRYYLPDTTRFYKWITNKILKK